MTKTTVDKVWETVQIARNTKRPTAQTLISRLFTEFVELHGDRLYGDDASFIGGIGLLGDVPTTVIGQEKGITTNEKIKRNFGMGHPEGYHKALRLMKQAEKFHRPILFIIDTPGAYPGVGAEERGQAAAIALNLAEMIALKTPMISVVLGEGGSGGALGIGVSDEVWMFENATYSILSPEGFASILYKDASLARQAAADMKLTAADLHAYGIIERIIPEVEGGLHNDPEYSFAILRDELIKKYAELSRKSIADLLENRYQKYRRIGLYAE
ncbi:MAG TPA: acetyl-CoA carboxylase carboxyltransferase subunit alpha [Acholeplasmataceae bacterium]|jgi:acetyl-CoA carboxylase carboxyl transferase subunit alpha|nr:acetyl-CoA carboxylase carboxyltransferase subunit alpha [Acholeplasmataceae bacterium]